MATTAFEHERERRKRKKKVGERVCEIIKREREREREGEKEIAEKGLKNCHALICTETGFENGVQQRHGYWETLSKMQI